MRTCRLLLLTMLVLLAAGPATQPSPKAAARLKQLKAEPEQFRLLLYYEGDQDKPYYQLWLEATPQPREDVLAFELIVPIKADQANRIIDHLAADGFLDTARDGDEKRLRSPSPNYRLTVHGQNIDLQEDLGFDLSMLKRLDALRASLDGDAAKKMDILLARLSGHRAEWEKAK